MKIYVLTAGEYSDYHIVTVATDKDKAEKIKNFLNERSYSWYTVDIEEYDTDEYTPDMRPLFRVDYYFRDKSGVITDIECTMYTEDYKNAMAGNDWNYYDRINFIRAYIFAEDKDHAEKIFYDRLAQWKAENEIM